MDYDIGNPDVSHCVHTNITTDIFAILNDSLNDYKIVEYGTIQYSTEFISKHFIELIDKYAPCVVDYTCNTWEQSFFLFPDEGVNYSDIEYPIYKIAENYVINVPIEFQIASKELNLSSNNIENKYNDYDISDEELQDRISKFGIVNGNSIVNVDVVMTLVLEESNKESKIVLAFISSQGENDFYSKSEILNNYSIKQMGLYDYSLSYVTYTPEELQISCKELSNSNDKTLIKK